MTCTLCDERAEFVADVLDAFDQREGRDWAACAEHLGAVLRGLNVHGYADPVFVVDLAR